MPLRDHFHSPLDDQRSWEELHGMWPAVLVQHLNRRLPPRYVAAPHIHIGAGFEIDVAALDQEDASLAESSSAVGGAVATATWAPPQPTLTLQTDLPEQDEYEVRVYDAHRHRRLVAAVEIVSPANKERSENRRAFVAKCVALLQQRFSVSIVDLVTTRQANLYADMLALLGQRDPLFSADAPSLYAAACRRSTAPSAGAAEAGPVWRLQTWAHTLAVGSPLPTLPLWLTSDFAVPLELEDAYEETCRTLRIG